MVRRKKEQSKLKRGSLPPVATNTQGPFIDPGTVPQGLPNIQQQGLPPIQQQALPAGKPQDLPKAPKQNIPKGAIPSQRGGLRRFLRNFLAVPLAKMVGITINPDPGWLLDPNADPFQAVANETPEVKQALDSLLDQMVQKFEGLTSDLPEISLKELEDFTPYALPTNEQIQQYIPQLPNTDFGPIEAEARNQFENRTIPSIAERFAGIGGTNSSALKGELARAASGFERQLAGLKSEHGLKQGALNIESQDAATKRAGILGNLGIAQGSQQLDRAKLLSQLQGQQNQNVLSQRDQYTNLLGLSTKRNMQDEQQPNQALQQLQQHPSSQFDPYKAIEILGTLGKNIATPFLI